MDETCRERKMDIPVDGLVICYDDTDYAASGSVTGHHATRAGFAFKWQDEAVDTKTKIYRMVVCGVYDFPGCRV